MSEGTIPSGNIESQPLTKTVLDNTPSVLVDDTNYLVDDTTALTGSQTTAIGTIRLSTRSDALSLNINSDYIASDTPADLVTVLAVHIGSQSQDVHTNTQTSTDAVVSALVASIPNLTHIAIAPQMDYADQFTKWATSIHNAGKKMFIRSPGFNDWDGLNGVPEYTSPQNYLINPEFEFNENNWGLAGSMTKQRTDAESHLGIYSLLLTATTVADFCYATFTDSGANPTVGSSYAFSCWLMGSGTVNLNLYDGAADNYSSNISLTNTWTQYSVTATCQGNGMLAGVRLNSSNNVSCYMDTALWALTTPPASQSFTAHCISQFTTWINSNFAIFQNGDCFEPLPDESENNTNWVTVYGGLGTPAGIAAYNQFITDSISAANTALTANGVNGVITGYNFSNPSAARDVISDTTTAQLFALGTDDYPESGLTVAATMPPAMADEMSTWIAPSHPGVPKHITFGPSVYYQLSTAAQAVALSGELDQIRAIVSPLSGITIWQFGAVDNNPKSRLFDWSGSIWVARQAAATINTYFSNIIRGSRSQPQIGVVRNYAAVGGIRRRR